jgi:FG-GAP repeat
MAFTGGVFVGCGDLNGDAKNDIVTGADVGGDAHVEAFAFSTPTSAPTAVESFYAYDPPFPGGVRVATGDIDGDGIAEIITGSGPSGSPHVRIFRVEPKHRPKALRCRSSEFARRLLLCATAGAGPPNRRLSSENERSYRRLCRTPAAADPAA